jgi:general secretion pathway protein G
MIELVFVIVVLGILASVAIPKLVATRDDAYVTQGRANILAIRSGIITERQARMFRGNSAYATDLNSTVGTDVPLFGNVLAQPISSKAANVDGGWRKTANFKYQFHLMGADVEFTYNPNNGTFDCVGGAGTSCALLTD